MKSIFIAGEITKQRRKVSSLGSFTLTVPVGGALSGQNPDQLIKSLSWKTQSDLPINSHVFPPHPTACTTTTVPKVRARHKVGHYDRTGDVGRGQLGHLALKKAVITARAPGHSSKITKN